MTLITLSRNVGRQPPAEGFDLRLVAGHKVRDLPVQTSVNVSAVRLGSQLRQGGGCRWNRSTNGLRTRSYSANTAGPPFHQKRAEHHRVLDPQVQSLAGERMHPVRGAFCNRIVGWKCSGRCDTELVLGALEDAVWSRQVWEGQWSTIRAGARLHGVPVIDQVG
ncbi:hypothetical protein AB0F91_42280 [Amycolatopsis sp. NPDC023774]|uniref:hypothetical protein n=1 Tax=Amycolatopsis sp. NPDC023774 TaxID=3155015 RepID=UPI0033CC3984